MTIQVLRTWTDDKGKKVIEWFDDITQKVYIKDCVCEDLRSS